MTGLADSTGNRGAGNRRIWMAAALVATLVGAGAAQAVVVRGVGALAAAGNGLAVVDLRGQLGVKGVGIVVADPDVVVRTDGVGQVSLLDDGRAVYEGFGYVVVESLDTRTRVEAAGARIRLRARGIGRAVLKGKGVYSTSDLDGAWDADATIEFESEELP